MTLFPKDLSDAAAALSAGLVTDLTPAAAPAEDLPADDLARALAEGESVLTESAAPDDLAWSARGDGLPGRADSFELVAPAASAGFSLGLSSRGTLGTYGTAALGLDVSIGSDSVEFEIAALSGCGCPMCGGFDPTGTGGSGSGAGVDAPGPAASLQTLANYLRDGFWDDFSGGNPRWYNMGTSGTGANSGTLYYNVTGFSGSRNGYTDSNGISAARQTMAREAFKLYGELMGITFIETTSDADHVDFFFIDNVYTSSGGQRAFASTALHSGSGGAIDYNVINITPGWSGSSSNIGGTNGYTFQTFLHEIGHAMGLGHQGIYNAGSGNPTYGNDAQWVNDTWQQTIMSYWSQDAWTASGASYAQLVSLMAADWVALNDLYAWQGYGSSNAFNGNTTYGVGTNITTTVSTAMANLATYAATNAFTIVDGSGIDTVDFSNYNVNQTINLTVSSASNTQATLSSVGGLTGNMTIAVGTVIENAVSGGGNDTLTGNQYNNQLAGNGGNDWLYGGDGSDTLYGGSGSDGLVGGNDADFLKGGAGADSLYGGAGDDLMDGEAGNDWLILQSSHGSFAGDSLYGGADHDTIWLYNDVASHSFDLRSSTISGVEAVSFSQGANLDKYLYLTAAQVNDGLSNTLAVSGNNASGSTDYIYVYMSHNSVNTQSVNLASWSFAGWQPAGDQNDRIYIFGTSLADTITGSNQNDSVSSGDGNDVIYGGSGNDTLDGLIGNDSLYGGIGSDYLWGYTGNDHLYGGDGNDTLTGEADHDLLDGGAGNDSMLGGDGNDTLYAGSGTDTLYGGEGTNSFFGDVSTSASLYYGGSGTDYFYKGSATSGSADESWYGGDGADYLFWTNTTVGSERTVNLATGYITFNGANRDVLNSIEHVYVYNGASMIGSAVGNVLLATGNFNNVIDGGAGADTLYGGEGNDTLYGGDGIDLIYGGDGDDRIEEGSTGLEGADSYYGGAGTDRLVKQSNTSSTALKLWDGGDGIDTFEWTDATVDGSWTVNLAAGAIYFGTDVRDSLVNIENIAVRNGANVIGNAGANLIETLGAFANLIEGGEGNDTIYAAGGSDTIYGGAGTDDIYGGGNSDLIYLLAGHGLDNFYGGGGIDTLDMSGASRNYNIDLAAGSYSAGGNTRVLTEIEILILSKGKDTVSGGATAAAVYGGGGTDWLAGAGSSDSLFGGVGADTLHSGTAAAILDGGAGNDWISLDAGLSANTMVDGGAGGDVLDLSGLGSGVVVDLAAGTASDGTFNASLVSIERVVGTAYNDNLTGDAVGNRLGGGGGNDVIYGGGGKDILQGNAGNDQLYGGAGNDSADGGVGNDTLDGGGGADTLSGSGGADVLYGGADNDLLDGGAGNDTLYGGTGADTLIGGANQDTFVFSTAGQIGNGANSDQILDFTSGQDKLDLSGFSAALTFIGTGAFSGTAGEVRYYNLAGIGYVVGDLDGNQIADFQLLLMNGAAVVAGDVIL